MASALLSPLNALDERVARSNARARSLALNAAQRRNAALSPSSHVKPSNAMKLQRTPIISRSSTAAHATTLTSGRRDVSSTSASIMSNVKAGGANSVGKSEGVVGGAAMAGRKAKYSVNALKEDLVEAEEDVNSGTNLVDSSEKLKEDDSIRVLNDGDKLAQLNLLDVAITKPLKGKQALMAEYELVHKPQSSVIALDDSVVGVDDDSDWEKIDRISDTTCQTMEARRLYSDILTAGPAVIAV